MRSLTRILKTVGLAGRRNSRQGVARDQLAPLFSAHWYVTRYEDVAAAGLNPLSHYAKLGWREGRQPHPLFDAAWYLEQNDDVRGAGVDPLRHYLDSGWREGRRPHILFDPERYQARYGIGAKTGQNPLVHYLTEGWRDGHDPHILFKTTWYLCTNPDVAAADIEPLSHYLTDGWKDGRRPHPAFDPAWYLETHRDVGRLRPEPLVHYLKHGWQEGRAPIATLQERRRKRDSNSNLNVLENGRTALERYVTTPRYLRTGEPAMFDPVYYRTLYDDLGDRSDAELYRHFITRGFAEGRIGKAIRPARVGPQHPPSPSTRARPRTPVKDEGDRKSVV